MLRETVTAVWSLWKTIELEKKEKGQLKYFLSIQSNKTVSFNFVYFCFQV
jgi:hypothetical protein